mmetsp:Transcript_118247/g.307110  ORF Transcript_118247/g.307110 Transcript_118247/m.307110 type:complete len:216 (+) Transcript_118247:1487-2134(+)
MRRRLRKLRSCCKMTADNHLRCNNHPRKQPRTRSCSADRWPMRALTPMAQHNFDRHPRRLLMKHAHAPKHKLGACRDSWKVQRLATKRQCCSTPTTCLSCFAAIRKPRQDESDRSKLSISVHCITLVAIICADLKSIARAQLDENHARRHHEVHRRRWSCSVFRHKSLRNLRCKAWPRQEDQRNLRSDTCESPLAQAARVANAESRDILLINICQ